MCNIFLSSRDSVLHACYQLRRSAILPEQAADSAATRHSRHVLSNDCCTDETVSVLNVSKKHETDTNFV